MKANRRDSARTDSGRQIRDYAQLPEKQQPYLRRPRSRRGPTLPIVHWIVVLLICLAIYNFGFSNRSLRTLFTLRRDTQAYVEREQPLEQKQARLTQEREALVRGEAVEKFARERHHFVGEDEEIYIEPRPDIGSTAAEERN